MRSTTTFRRGHVVVVSVAHTDQSGGKPRPALVVSAEAFHRELPDLLLCPISSQPRYYSRPGMGDRPLREWSAVGLRYPSTVRISKLLAVEKRIVRRVLGRLKAGDMEQVDSGLRETFGIPLSPP